MALLLPISESIQDSYRFPFKIAEYTACRVPIITSKVGAVENYFNDLENAIFSLPNNIDDFSEKMNYCIQNELSHIANNSYNIGYENFNYDNLNIDLNKFINWEIK